MKLLTFSFLLLTLFKTSFSQDIYDITLENCKVTSRKTKTVEIFGKTSVAEIYRIKAQIKVCENCIKYPHLTPCSPIYTFKVEKYELIVIPDVDSTYLDLLLSTLTTYWKSLEAWDKRAEYDVLKVACFTSSFLVSDTISIPYLKVGNFDNNHMIYYHNNRLYKIAATQKKNSISGVINFKEQCLSFTQNGTVIKPLKRVEDFETAKAIMSEYHLVGN